MSSFPNSLTVASQHKKLEPGLRSELSIHSTTSPSEPESEPEFEHKMDEIQSSKADLTNYSPTEYTEVSPNLMINMAEKKLSRKKRFKHKVVSKLKTLLYPSKKTRKIFSFVHVKRRSRNLEYNFALQPNSQSHPAFLRKLSINNHFNDDKINSKKSTMDSSIEKFEKLNFESLLFNNICIEEDVDIQVAEGLETTYDFNEKLSTEGDFKSVFGILPIKQNNAESAQNESIGGTDLLSIERQRSSSTGFACIDNVGINNINISSLLEKKGSMLTKSGQFEEYLKLKFEELEESRNVLNNFLKSPDRSQDALRDYKIDLCNLERVNTESKRLHKYFQLANKLSKLSFECLLSSPNELVCQQVYNKDGVRVWKKEHKSGRVLLRTEFIVPVAPLDYVEYSTDSNNRRVYDNNTVDLKVVETVSSGLDVMYVATKRIATVYPRDIVNIRFLHGFNIKECFKFMNWDELNTSSARMNQENLICCSCSCSIEHPDAPERQGYVRMDLSIGSYMAVPIKTPFGIWSSISMFNEASPKGWIPSSVTKMIAAKMVPGSVESIVSSMLAHYKFPFRNKINRPLSGFCHRTLTTIFSDQKRLEHLDSHYQKDPSANAKGVSNEVVNHCNDLKCSKSSSKISFLLSRPLLMSIQDFIAVYKSNSLQEFIEHFNSVQIINRYILSASSSILSPNNSDLICCSNANIPGNCNIIKTNDHSKQSSPIDPFGSGIFQITRDYESKLFTCNIPIEKLPKSANKSSNATYFNHVLNAGELTKFNCIPSFERPCSFEFCEATNVTDHQVIQNSKKQHPPECDSTLTYLDREKIDRKRVCNLFINSCKLYQSLGASYLAEISDIITLVRLSSLD